MGQHTITYLEHEKTHEHSARCRCGWAPEPMWRITKDMVKDEVRKHERFVERVRTHASFGGGTLKGDRDHAKKMMEQAHISDSDRALWKQLYEELDRRLGSTNSDPPPELPLFSH